MAVTIGPTSGYLKLDSWRLAKIIQMSTFKFCYRVLNRRNDPDGKQFGQTTGAARAVPANIAEGSARHQTSIETEMRLLDVARASLSEVLDDMMFVLLANGQAVWSEDDERTKAVRSIRLDPVTCDNDMLHNVTQQILLEYSKFSPWTEHEDTMVCANAIIVLCQRVIKMLRNQIEKRLDEFSQNGGFTENMTQTRMNAVRDQTLANGAPTCPKCGAPMVRRMAKKGINQGNEFWSCTKWRETGCNTILPIAKGR